MGWLFTDLDQASLIRELTLPTDNERCSSETVHYTYRDSVLWSLVKLTAKEGAFAGMNAGDSTYYIRCDLFERGRNGWGYKALDESMHPYYYGCPLEYLDKAPEVSPEWRQKVREHHRRACSA